MSTPINGNVRERAISLELFHSGVNSIRTTVYARVRGVGTARDCHLEGTIRGPFSLVSQTLPATFVWTDCGPGETLLAKVCLPDPCAWSPRTPSSYRVDLQIIRAGQVIHELTADFGIRDLIPHGRSLLSFGVQRVVLRGVSADHTNWDSMADWRATEATMLVTEPDDSLCRMAANEGVIICARLSGADRLIDRFRRIASFPSVAVIWIDDATIHESLKQIAPNVLIAAAVDDSRNRELADLLVWSVDNPSADTTRAFDKPVLALRPLTDPLPLAEARAACDRLQSDLAPQHDLAGYFV